ncbi:hypothetical protein [Halomonas llamarensis]|uniref:Uncharacterized protein n=1 Tax=Halomonas llamarensis TaxID=2945104 RepID=A0ABT0SVK5_9GAMM|nr:hypothetical protein [Halomonas llamarensis]MCL7931324.1 hypothetical protein [Halomonas llamarensis]
MDDLVSPSAALPLYLKLSQYSILYFVNTFSGSSSSEFREIGSEMGPIAFADYSQILRMDPFAYLAHLLL